MAIIFQDGFETLPFTGLVKIPPWTATSIVGVGSALIVEALDPNQGTYNAKATCAAAVSNARCWKIFAANDPVFARYYVKFLNINLPAPFDLCRLLTLDATDWQYLSAVTIRNNAGTIVWALDTFEAGVQTNTFSVVTPVTGQWYCVELKRDVANNRQEIWVDNVSILTQNMAITTNTSRIYAGIYRNEQANLNVNRFDCVDVQDQRVFCKVPFGGGCNPAQMCKVILGL